jgi:hypothetical protein
MSVFVVRFHTALGTYAIKALKARNTNCDAPESQNKNGR